MANNSGMSDDAEIKQTLADDAAAIQSAIEGGRVMLFEAIDPGGVTCWNWLMDFTSKAYKVIKFHKPKKVRIMMTYDI